MPLLRTRVLEAEPIVGVPSFVEDGGQCSCYGVNSFSIMQLAYSMLGGPEWIVKSSEFQVVL